MDKKIDFMERAIELARTGMASGGGPFGAVVVRENTIISEAYNRVVLNHDPTAHAEVAAIRSAASILGSHNLEDCAIYSSCEPCPMCLGAIYWAGIREVYYASTRKDAEDAGFSDRMIYDELALVPELRAVKFTRVNNGAANEVFRRWKDLEKKIPY